MELYQHEINSQKIINLQNFMKMDTDKKRGGTRKIEFIKYNM